MTPEDERHFNEAIHAEAGVLSLAKYLALPIVRSALVCGVLALALASVMCLVAGLPVIPGWLQGVSAISGAAVGAIIGKLRLAS